MKTFRISVLMIIITVIFLSCENTNDNNGKMNRSEIISSEVDDIENTLHEENVLYSEILNKVDTTMNKIDDITKGKIDYENMKQEIELLFSDTAAISIYLDLIGDLIIWSDGNDELVYAKDLTEDSIKEYRSIIRDAIGKGERWYFTNYQVSNIICDEVNAKVLVKLIMQTDDEYYFMYSFSINDNNPRIINFVRINYLRDELYFKDFSFNERIMFEMD